MSSQWSMLPSDLLLLISDRLRCLTDRIRFESVCTGWRRAAAENRHLLTPPVPMALIPGGRGATDHELFSVVNGGKFRVHLPKTCRTILGASLGWLVVLHHRHEDISDRTLCLLNPITRSQITLPLGPKYSFVSRVVLSSNPLSSDCFIMVIRRSIIRWSPSWLSFCRIGDDGWTDLKTDSEDCFEDLAYFRRTFYALTDLNKVVRCQTDPTLAVSVVARSGDELDRCRIYNRCRTYMVESLSGELLVVTLHVPNRRVHHSCADVAVTVCIVDFGTGSLRRIGSLGDENLYVGNFYLGTGNASSSAKGSGGSECGRNCIYFSAEDVKHWIHTSAPLNAAVFDLENLTMEPLFQKNSFDESSFPLIWLNLDRS